MIQLFDYQRKAVDQLRSGSILCGGVGSGKSIVALAYFLEKECFGHLNFAGELDLPIAKKKDLYVITTARKRDSLEWEKDASKFLVTKDSDISVNEIELTVDSWNNIGKYTEIKNAFFIFDEQRIVGAGAWVKSFLKIVKNNTWILLSATPGDTWIDYIPVFIANGFYRNRTEFVRRHVVYNNYAKFPKIDRYLETGHLTKLANKILVKMDGYKKTTIPTHEHLYLDYDMDLYKTTMRNRWNIYENKPMKGITELIFVLRRIVNSDPSRLEVIRSLIEVHPKIIVFYNFNYELDILRSFSITENIPMAEWNGHKHEPIPDSDRWLYLVQFTSGSEGWNCTETNATIFYSQNYSYKMTIQAAGRIDRLNTKFTDLYYYHLKSRSSIDISIDKSLKSKRAFNERNFIKS